MDAISAAADARRQLRILNGLHDGALTLLEDDEHYVIGADAQCAIVLCDDGVAARHCVVQSTRYGATCRALDGSVTLDGRTLAPGDIAAIGELDVLECGPVRFSVGPADADWESLSGAAASRPSPLDVLRSAKRWNPYALFCGVLIGMMGVLGAVYAALSTGEAELNRSQVTDARQWLQTIAPAGSELTIGVENSRGKGLLLSGYVTADRDIATLENASRASRFKPRIDVHSAENMTRTLSRLAQLSDIACKAEYLSGGRIACANAVASEGQASRLRLLVRDVPGATDVHVRIAPPVQPPPPPIQQSTPAPPVVTEKFAVLMTAHERYLIDRVGKKYVEGDQFNGLRIRRIGLDQVIFERDGRRYEFQVAALGVRAEG